MLMRLKRLWRTAKNYKPLHKSDTKTAKKWIFTNAWCYTTLSIFYFSDCIKKVADFGKKSICECFGIFFTFTNYIHKRISVNVSVSVLHSQSKQGKNTFWTLFDHKLTTFWTFQYQIPTWYQNYKSFNIIFNLFEIVSKRNEKKRNTVSKRVLKYTVGYFDIKLIQEQYFQYFKYQNRLIYNFRIL